MHFSLPGSSAHRILQAGILEWVAISFPRESSQLKDQTHGSCIVGQVLYHWATREPREVSAIGIKKFHNSHWDHSILFLLTAFNIFFLDFITAILFPLDTAPSHTNLDVLPKNEPFLYSVRVSPKFPFSPHRTLSSPTSINCTVLSPTSAISSAMTCHKSLHPAHTATPWYNHTLLCKRLFVTF